MSENIPWVRWKGHYVVVEGKPRENTPGCLRGKFTRICELDDELTARQKGHYIKRILSVPRLESENSDLRARLAQAEAGRDTERLRLLGVLREIKDHLTIPAAEYVPAIGDVFLIIDAAVTRVETATTTALDVLSSHLCEAHTEEVKRMGFQEFATREQAAGCQWCIKARLSQAEKDRDAAVNACQDAIADAVIDNVLLQERLDKAVKGFKFIDAVLERPVSAGNVVEAKAKAHAILSELEEVSGE